MQRIEVKITFVDVVDFKVVFDENEETHKEFLKQIVLKINRLKEKYPYLEFKIE